jgi:hypothetical protein
MQGIRRSRRIAYGSCHEVYDLRRLQPGRLCGNCLPLEFRRDYTPATGSIPPGSSPNRKEDL